MAHPRAAMTRRGVAILGSTGSIGTTALRVLGRHADAFYVAALTAHSNAALLEEQAREFQPSFVGIVQNGAEDHKDWRHGPACLIEAATRDDAAIVLNAVVGAAGVGATPSGLSPRPRGALGDK